MPAWTPSLSGWDVGPPLHEWRGLRLHPAARQGAPAAAARTLWLGDDGLDPERRDLWLARIAAARAWLHPGLPTVHDGGLWEGRPWAVTDPVRRGNLWNFRTHAQPPPGEVDELARQLLAVLAWAHGLGFAHGAVGGDALLVERGGVYRLAGLGLVDVLDDRRTWVDGAPDLRRADLVAVAALLRDIGRSACSPALIAVLAAVDAGAVGAEGLRAMLGGEPAPDAPAPAAPAPEAPKLRLGRYLLEEQLGQGGMGVVWRASDPELERVVAIKVHHPAAVLPEEALARFRQEARAAGRLDHPALVRILDFGEAPEGLFYAMELVDGPDLAKFLKEVGRLEPRQAARWAATLARGLAHAHKHGIVHRDLKPANILVEDREIPRITDFGLAFSLGDEGTRLTRVGQVMGTPVYMAPEQAAGRVDLIGPKTDIYSLGALLYEMTTGRPPFRDGPPAAVIYDIAYNEPTPIRSLRADVPLDLAHICMRAMSPDPRHRYPTMDSFADDLERFLVGEPVSARAPSWGRRVRRWVLRHRTAVVGGLGTLVGLALVSGAWGLRSRSAAESLARREAIAAARLDDIGPEVAALHAAGDAAGAERRFGELVAMPELQGTEAWRRAWLEEAERHAQADDAEGERDALGRVWLASDSPTDRVLALTRIAGSWRESWNFAEVEAVLRAIGVERGGAPPTATEARLAAEAALYRWATPEGTAVAPVVEALARRRPVGLDRSDVDLAPGGFLRASQGAEAWRVRPTGVERLPPPAAGWSFRRLLEVGGEVHAVVTGESGTRLLVLRDGAWVTNADFPLTDLHRVELADLGRPGLVLGTHRSRSAHLASWDGTTWRLSDPLWPSGALNSDFGGAVAVDADDDGLRELVVALGAWGAYDLRIYSIEGGPRLLRRLQVGNVADPTVLRLADGALGLAVAVRSEHRNHQLFREQAPEQSVRVFRLRKGELEPLFSVRSPRPCRLVGAGDLDGDGRHDLAASCGGSGLILRQEAAGGFEPVVLADFAARGAADVDGDGDLELLAFQEGAAWFAGTGEERRPPLPTPDSGAWPAPEGLDQVSAEIWAREEALVAMGLVDAAAERLDVLADQVPAVRAMVLARKAEVLAGVGRLEEAARAWLEVPGSGAQALPVVRAAVDVAAARAFLARGDDLPELASLAGVPRVELDFGGSLDPRLEILDPGAVRTGEGGLRVEPIGTRPALRLPLDVEGGPLGLEVELATELVEWDGSLEVAIVAEGAAQPTLAAFVAGRGGGGVVATEAAVSVGPTEPTLRVGRPRRVAATSETLRLRVAVDPAAGLRRRIDADGRPVLLDLQPGPVPAPRPGRYALVVSGRSDWSASARLVALIRRILIEGASIGSGPVAGPVAAAATALARDDAASALRTLGAARGGIADEVRIQALLEQGEGAEAARVCAAWLEEAPPAALTRLARARPRWLLPLIESAEGPRGAGRVWEAWRAALTQLPEDPDVGRDFAAWAEDVSDPGVGAADRVEMELALARVARSQGRLSLAAGILERVRADLPGLPPGDAAALLASALAREQAIVAVRRGDQAEAFAALRAALDLHPAPEVVAELVSADPVMAPLREDPLWSALVSPYLRYGASAR